MSEIDSRGHAIPVDPSAERVVERNAIFENKSAARAAGAETAQRYTLSRGIRGAAAGAAEEAEPRDLAQRVIEGEGRDGLHFCARELNIAQRDIAEERLAAGGCDDYALIHRGWDQSDFELNGVACCGGPRFLQGIETSRVHYDRAGVRGNVVEREYSGGIGCRGGRVRSGVQFYLRGRDGGAARIPHDALDSELLGANW